MKFKLTESDIKKLILETLKNLPVMDEDAFSDRASRGVMDAFNNVYDTNPEFQKNMDDFSSHIGVIPGKQEIDYGYDPKNKKVVTPQYNERVNISQYLRDWGDKIRKAAEELRNGYVDENGITHPYVKPDGAIENNLFNDCDNPHLNELMRMKDTLDMLNLTYLYMPLTKWRENMPKSTTPLGDKAIYDAIKKEIEKNPNEVPQAINNLKLRFDNEAINAWAREGETRMKKYGEVVDGKKNIKDGVFEDMEVEYLTNLVDKLISNSYGVGLDIPNTPFTYGNSKLPKDTLVINFTSAHRCPAWNDCLVKYACYARTSEHGYSKTLYVKNKKLHALWKASEFEGKNQTILNAMKQLIRMYIISLENFYRAVSKQPDAGELLMGLKRDTWKEVIYNKLNESGFDGLSDREREIINDPKFRIKRVSDIRLNEEGDFIGQWLLDAVDTFAGELGKINISVVAYTCRNLNLDGIRNIIINASKSIIGSNGQGGSADAVARRFYAVTPEFYNSMDETYATQVERGTNKPLRVGPPTYITTEPGGDAHIIPFPQPLYDEQGDFLHKYYYKCPCGRGETKDFSKKEEEIANMKAKLEAMKAKLNPIKYQEALDNIRKREQELAREQIFNYYSNPSNLKLRTKKNNDDDVKHGINCFDCRICYQPKMTLEGDNGNPVIVIVQVHSSNSALFNFEKAKKMQDGGFSNNFNNDFMSKRNTLFGTNQPQVTQSTLRGALEEALQDINAPATTINDFEGTHDEAMRIVADNGKNSMQERFGNSVFSE